MPTDCYVNGQPLFQSAVCRAHKRVEYTGHAVELPASANAGDVKDFMTRISTQCYSAECAPFACRLETVSSRSNLKTAVDLERDGEGPDCEEEGGDGELQGDNGEFSAGAILAACLRNCEKLYGSSCKREGEGGTGNVLLVVTRRVRGCFVADMVQPLKYTAIRACAAQALDRLNFHLATRHLERAPQEAPMDDSVASRQRGSPGAAHNFTRPTVTARTLPVPSSGRQKQRGREREREKRTEEPRKKEGAGVDANLIPDFHTAPSALAARKAGRK
jgi:hypothetical protein